MTIPRKPIPKPSGPIRPRTVRPIKVVKPSIRPKPLSYQATNKIRAVAYLGGKCVDCGLIDECTAIYDFHHLNPANKVGVSMGKAWEELKLELEKCVLLCANCHRKRHAYKRGVKT